MQAPSDSMQSGGLGITKGARQVHLDCCIVVHGHKLNKVSPRAGKLLGAMSPKLTHKGMEPMEPHLGSGRGTCQTSHDCACAQTTARWCDLCPVRKTITTVALPVLLLG